MDIRREMMRIFILVTIAALLIPGQVMSADKAQDHIVVYYFHSNFRCVNCHNIEQYTKEALDQYFQKELKSGRIVFKVINTDTRGNEHFMKDYQLYTKSVVLSLVKNDKEVRYENLAKVWNFLTNRDAFHKYIKTEIEKYNKEL